jgi:perosamine synthetase
VLNDVRVPMAAPDIREEDIDAVERVLRSGMLAHGPEGARFEAAFAAYVGTRHAVAVSSGTAGLHLCVRAARIGPGDEVVTTPFGFVASANCILFEHATPVFADIEEASLNLDPRAAAAAVTPRTRGLLPVHVFGQPCAMRELVTLAADAGIALIEDACEAIGAEYEGRRVGAFGQSAVFSFFPNKQMTTGEGAVITTDDDEVAGLLRSLRNQGRDGGGAWLTHERLGFNYRLDEMSAALGVSQLGRIDAMLAARARVAALYREGLEGVPGVRLISPLPTTTRLSWFAAIVRLDDGLDRDVVIERLADLGIPARAYFAAIHLQPFYRKTFGYGPGDFPIAEKAARTTLALPFFNAMTQAQVETVCEALGRVLACAPA